MAPTCPPEQIRQVKPRWPIRMYMRFTRIQPLEALNCGEMSVSSPDANIATELKAAVNRLKAAGFDNETGQVNYSRLAGSEAFHDYIRAAQALREFDPRHLNTPHDRKAFWINLYNALIIHAVIVYKARNAIREIAGVFERAAYIIGGYRFSANDIEHGILRANIGHPALPGRQFASNDPRSAFCLDQPDPRIHFTLVCAARSCPPIAVYQPDRIDQQLHTATRNFVNNGGVVVNQRKRTVLLSRIFSWYAGDFGGRLFGYGQQANILRYIAPYLSAKKEAAFIQENAEHLTVRYSRYDWSLNV